MSNPAIIHKTHASSVQHPTVETWYKGDHALALRLCPFPTQTDTFKVLNWGWTEPLLNRDPAMGHSPTVVLVEYTKSCGHTVRERIPFIEGVTTFTHFGTVFTGESYSVNDWQRRIEYFRKQLPCAVCSLVRHAVWIYQQRLGETRSRVKAITNCIDSLDYNYANWREFVTEAQITEWFHNRNIPEYIVVPERIPQ